MLQKIANFLKLGPVFGYFLRVFKKDTGEHPTNTNIRMMHGINRISIIMFLLAVGVMVYRAFFRP
ncbi:MAG: DUF6728 family protein [Leadbetterella sp.]